MPYVTKKEIKHLQSLRQEAIEHAIKFSSPNRQNYYYIRAVTYNTALRVLGLDLSVTTDMIEKEIGIQ